MPIEKSKPENRVRLKANLGGSERVLAVWVQLAYQGSGADPGGMVFGDRVNLRVEYFKRGGDGGRGLLPGGFG